MFSKFSSLVMPKATSTWKSQDFPTKQIASAFVFNKAERPGSFSALLPVFFVMPKAVRIVFSNLGGLLKKVVSKVFAPGQPPSK